MNTVLITDLQMAGNSFSLINHKIQYITLGLSSIINQVKNTPLLCVEAVRKYINKNIGQFFTTRAQSHKDARRLKNKVENLRENFVSSWLRGGCTATWKGGDFYTSKKDNINRTQVLE